MTEKTVVIETSGYTEVIVGRERHRITYDTIPIRTRIERKKPPFLLPSDLEAVKTPAVSGGYVFKICKKGQPKD
jgi:hypothetical protein